MYNINKNNVNYLVKLINKHGFDILRNKKNKYYSSELKQEIINKVLISGNSISQTSIDYGLLNPGLLTNWIRLYKKNNCVIVEKKKGRASTMNNKFQNKKYEDMTLEEKFKYLENKNLYLQAENEYLKKLHAVIQKKKNQQLKKN